MIKQMKIKKKLTLKTVYLITQINNFLREMPNDEKDAERQQLIKANNKTTNIKKIVTLKLQKVH